MSLSVLPPVPENIKQQLWSELGLSERNIKEAVQSIKNWLELQPHLPNDFDDNRIERWLIRCGNSIEKTKNSLNIYYTTKTVFPELMADWKTDSEWFKNGISYMYSVPMPDLRADFNRVILCGFTAKQTSEFTFENFSKVFFMMMDIRMNEDYCYSDAFVLDMKNCTMDHVLKISHTLMKKNSIIYLKGYGAEFKELHFINVPTHAHGFVNTVKAIFGTGLAAKIHVHGDDLTNLYKYIPKKYFTTYQNGEGNSLSERWLRWTKHMESYRTYFKDRENLKSDESKRPDPKFNTDDLFGSDGSFRHLDVE